MTRLNDNHTTRSEPTCDRQLESVPHAHASRGFAAAFGLDIRAALLTVIVDVMVFSLDAVSLEALLPLGVLIAAGLGMVVYRIQRESGDDKQQAITKAVLIGLLTAIPAPLSPIIAVPAGLLGAVKKLGRK